jgi:alkylation response protein AidB-like acyl-CoA dehydrogenase
MDFSLVEEQQMLRDSLARFIQKDYTFERRRANQALAEGFSRDTWAQFAEMGMLGIALPQDHGGFGGSSIDTMIVMNAIGNGLVVEPYLATVVLGARALVHGGSPAQRAEFLPAVSEGKRLLAFAHGEAEARYAQYHVSVTARRDGNGFVLEGGKSVVMHGAQADALIVSARTSGATGDARGITLFLVDAKTKGVARRDYRTIDGLRAADVALAGVRVASDAIIGEVDGGSSILDRVLDDGVAALCAEAVGVMESLNAQTLEYIKTRQQFGQPIGRFQVLQHRAVDMMIHCEQSRSIAILAAMRADSADARERAYAISAAKVHIGRSGRALAQSAYQLHGGMGLTNELPASHYGKRLTMIDFWLGDTDHHLSRFIANS